MKEIKIIIRVGEKKIAYAIETTAYDRKNIQHQLELLGVMKTTESIIEERINTLMSVNSK